MNPLPKMMLAAALLVLAVGIGLAVVQPGSLGGDDDETAAPGGATTTTASDDETTTSTGEGESATTTAPTPTTSPATDPSDEQSTTTRPGSGLGSPDASGSADTADGLAATGGESLMLAGIGLAAAGILARRRIGSD